MAMSLNSIRIVRYLFFFLVIFFGSACSTITKISEPDRDVIINDLIQGKMKKVNGDWFIYEQTNDMAYEVNDRCIYNKQSIDCLRHGFIISYDSNGKNIQLNCKAETNVTVNAGNVEREKYVDTNVDDFYMLLKGDEKKFVNVQYVSGQPGLDDLYIETSCSFKDREVFRFGQRVRF